LANNKDANQKQPGERSPESTIPIQATCQVRPSIAAKMSMSGEPTLTGSATARNGCEATTVQPAAFGSPLGPCRPINRHRFTVQRSLGGLCVEVSVPVPPWFRFSIPVGLGDDGCGLCVELVLPTLCPEEELDVPPAFSAKDIVLVPAKRTIATTVVPILRCILHS
jgi:hypothetical protein